MLRSSPLVTTDGYAKLQFVNLFDTLTYTFIKIKT